MPISNGKITGAVGMGDISSALGISSLDIGTLIKTGGEQGLINKYARYKPFRSSSANLSTFAQYESALQAAYFGLTIPDSANYSNFRQNYATTMKWTYAYPRGLDSYSEWYRMLDFKGYTLPSEVQREWGLGEKVTTNMVTFGAPFGFFMRMRSKTLGVGDVIIISITGADPDIGGTRSGFDEGTGLLYANDFQNSGYGNKYSQWHFGLAFIHESSYLNDRYWVSSASLATDLTTEVEATISITNNLPNGNYTVVPILAYGHTSDTWADYNALNGSNTALERAISLDGYAMTRFVKSASASGFSAIISSVYISGSNAVCKVTFVNATASSVSLSTIFTYIESDTIFDSDAEHSAITAGVTAWVNSGTKYTSGISQGGRVVAAYRAQSAITVAADSQPHEYTFTLATSTTDADGNEYDDRAHVYLCVQQGSTRKVYE